LKRLHTIPEIRSALTQLPKTLDETYERIPCMIPPEIKGIVHRTLNLVACNNDFTPEYLAELLAVDIDNRSFDRQNSPFDIYAPVEACTCLLTYDVVTDTLALAHYTVKEYLNSSRIALGPAKIFHMTDDSMYAVTASCLIIYMLYDNYDIKSSSLMPFAVAEWHPFIRKISSKSLQNSLSLLIIQLLNPTERHYPKWKNEVKDLDWDDKYPIWSAEPEEECSVILASLCWFGFIEAAEVLLDMQDGPTVFYKSLHWSVPVWKVPNKYIVEGYSSDNRNPDGIDQNENFKQIFLSFLDTEESGLELVTVSQISMLSDKRSTDFLKLMTSKGADVNVRSSTGFSGLETLLFHDTECLYWIMKREGSPISPTEFQLRIDFLLANGAQNDHHPSASTSLQSAIRYFIRLKGLNYMLYDYSYLIQVAISTLLKTGAKANQAANDEVNMERIRHTCQYFLEQQKDPSILLHKDKYINYALQNRGTSSFYDTPLRMLENRLEQLNKGKLTRDKTHSFTMYLDTLYFLKKLLQSHGAKSLHLFPVKGLPGYVEEDMEEWNKLNASLIAPAACPPASE
jgi:hypothetical protein